MPETSRPSFDLDQYVPYLLNRAGSVEAQTFTQLLAQHNISISTWRILAALNQYDDQSMGELSRSTSIEISTLSRTIAALEKQGLVKRARKSADARVVSVQMTQPGQRITNSIIPEAIAHETARLADFSDQERRTLISLLQRLYKNLTQTASISSSGETYDARPSG
ncbi:MAG: MarR family transcriptional regulator [Pseudomonadota bacterium]